MPIKISPFSWLNEPSKIEDTMSTGSKEEFVKIASFLLKPFSGEIKALQPFWRTVESLKTLSDDDNDVLLLQFVKTRLEGKALDVVPSEVDSLDQLLALLSANIRPDPSEIVEARLLRVR